MQVQAIKIITRLVADCIKDFIIWFDLATNFSVIKIFEWKCKSNRKVQASYERDTVTRVQILDEIDCISHITDTLGKGMNPIILPPAMSK